MAISPTARTLMLLRQEGYLAEVVEKWIPGANIRRDLFGFVDVLAIDANGSTLAVQATSGSNVSARLAKCRDAIVGHPRLRETGWRFEVHGWRKVGGRWACRREEV
jgi:hypothetical protein